LNKRTQSNRSEIYESSENCDTAYVSFGSIITTVNIFIHRVEFENAAISLVSAINKHCLLYA